MRSAWWAPSTAAAIFCGGIGIGSAIQHHYAWMAFDAALALLNLGVLWWLARARRRSEAARAEFEAFTREWRARWP